MVGGQGRDSARGGDFTAISEYLSSLCRFVGGAWRKKVAGRFAKFGLELHAGKTRFSADRIAKLLIAKAKEISKSQDGRLGGFHLGRCETQSPCCKTIEIAGNY